MTNNKWKKYVLWFAQEHVDFRASEFDSIVKLFGLPHRKLSKNLQKPYWIVEFPDDDAVLKFSSRSICLRCILELWSYEKNRTRFHDQIRSYISEKNTFVKKYFQSDTRFKITVETYNKHFTQKEKIDKIETLNYLPLAGNVDLKTPQVEWWLIEFWGLDPTNVPHDPEALIFGRLLAQGQRQLIKELCLKQRKFIGNTSMDPQLSLLMANQVLASDNDLIFDPFVGTGSLLVSAAKFGAYVLGADIDFMMLHARSRPSRISQKVREKDESIRANLAQYGCVSRYLDVLVSDFSNEVWRDGFILDGIITDPPYGIREATEKVETKQTIKPNSRTADMPHYPSTSHYALESLFTDLLIFAAKRLKIGGRLVCWLPFHREDYSHKMLPQHPCLTLIANSEQPLTGLTSRRLLTYEKHSEPCAKKVDDFIIGEFRERYFDSGVESRTERRIRKAEQREHGRLEALKRGKELQDARELKCNLNKARFD